LYHYQAHKIHTPNRTNHQIKQHSTKMTKIAIVYCSMKGHIATMAEAVKKGVEAGGASVDTFQVPMTLPKEVLAKIGAPPKADQPIITPPAQLVDCDGIIFGVSGGAGRYGMVSAQLKVTSKLLQVLSAAPNYHF
jgi:multimeric flavodoxin WrbA